MLLHEDVQSPAFRDARGDVRSGEGRIRLFLKAYRWRRTEPVSWTPLSRPLTECGVALVTSAGFVLSNQEPFDTDIRWWVPRASCNFR